MCLKIYEIDLEKAYSDAEIAQRATLKKTRVKLDFLIDTEK